MNSPRIALFGYLKVKRENFVVVFLNPTSLEIPNLVSTVFFM